VDRLFLDANILFSASYREDAGVTVLWSLENVGLFTSPYAIEEAKRNLAKRDQKKRLERLTQSLQLVQTATAPDAITREVNLPDKDWPILGGAIAAEATHLITGDLKHFGPYFGQSIHGILVLPPADYIRGTTRTS
jgi:predicted nucleic acid-binding protein